MVPSESAVARKPWIPLPGPFPREGDVLHHPARTLSQRNMTTNTTPQFVPDARAVPPIQFLNPDGVLADGAEPAMDDATVIEALRCMVHGRAFDAKSFSLQRQGKLGRSRRCRTGGIPSGSAFATDPARTGSCRSTASRPR